MNLQTTVPDIVLEKKRPLPPACPPTRAQAPNTVVSHKNLCLAVRGIHNEKACLFGHDPEYESAGVSQTIRQHLSKVKDVYKYTHLRDIVFARANDGASAFVPRGSGGIRRLVFLFFFQKFTRNCTHGPEMVLRTPPGLGNQKCGGHFCRRRRSKRRSSRACSRSSG